MYFFSKPGEHPNIVKRMDAGEGGTCGDTGLGLGSGLGGAALPSHPISFSHRSHEVQPAL